MNSDEIIIRENSQISNQINSNVFILDEIPEYDIQDYDIFNEKDNAKYLADIEKAVRSSYEYREYISYLRQYMDMNKCSFFENVSNQDTFKIKIHLHHCPLTLYDITVTVFNKRMYYKESLELEMVAKEVMYVHYFLMVGLIPLAETVHELVHNNYLFIPIDKVLGDYERFIEMYREWIPPETLDKLKALQDKTRLYNAAANIEILQRSNIMVSIPYQTDHGTYKLPKMETILQIMDNRIKEIKSQRSKQIRDNSYYDNNVIYDQKEEKKLIRPFIYED